MRHANKVDNKFRVRCAVKQCIYGGRKVHRSKDVTIMMVIMRQEVSGQRPYLIASSNTNSQYISFSGKHVKRPYHTIFRPSKQPSEYPHRPNQ